MVILKYYDHNQSNSVTTTISLLCIVVFNSHKIYSYKNISSVEGITVFVLLTLLASAWRTLISMEQELSK